MISDQISQVMENIEHDAAQADTGERVKLIAVTKFRPVEDMRALAEFGLRDFGENHVQEFNQKYESFGDDINWHIIGSLQKNKLKYIVGKVRLIQSVDSVSLAQAIDDMSCRRGVCSEILLETNVSGEASKHGFTPSALADAVEQIAAMKNIGVRGLMMMAPDVDDEVYLGTLFEKTRNIFDGLMKNNGKYDNIKFEILSMGMSHDYRLAVKAGSNMVRLGRILYQ